MKQHNCRICGLYFDDAPWGDDNNSPTYEICPCCGVEFGDEDYILESIRKYRQRWINQGYNWFMSKRRP
ncbi:MAG TPA: hypothetical protein VFS31_03550, partial [Chitinophagaceae bacterium]|nr:hypothetical protein [Chitinophagaceae bacterium]